MARIRELAVAEHARRAKVAEAAERMLAPLAEVVSELQDVGIEARLNVATPGYGSVMVDARLLVPRFHPIEGRPVDWEEADLPLVGYDIHADTASGRVEVTDAVPTPEDDPDAYEWGGTPEPTWRTMLTTLDVRHDDTVLRLSERLRILAVEREMSRMGPCP